jgi:hypothetical protein
MRYPAALAAVNIDGEAGAQTRQIRPSSFPP